LNIWNAISKSAALNQPLLALNPIECYLQSTEVINWQDAAVRRLANELAAPTVEETAKRCFEWVRDEIRHSMDYRANPVTCAASDVLRAGTGYCYAKSHLLAALLRANSIPAGLCYQRLSLDDDGLAFCLHGLNAVYLPERGWYRIDARATSRAWTRSLSHQWSSLPSNHS
jgi:transglutaminase-like putative cysteine protease